MAGPLRFPESTKPINKVVLNGDIKIDLTGDTVQPSNLLKGIKAHGPDGNIITGTIKELCTKDNCKIKGYYLKDGDTMYKIISHEKMNVFAQLTKQYKPDGNTYYSDAFKYANGMFSLSGKMMKDPDEINNHCKNTN